MVCEEKEIVTRLKRVRRKEGVMGSDSLWKRHSEARRGCEKTGEKVVLGMRKAAGVL